MEKVEITDKPLKKNDAGAPLGAPAQTNKKTIVIPIFTLRTDVQDSGNHKALTLTYCYFVRRPRTDSPQLPMYKKEEEGKRMRI